MSDSNNYVCIGNLGKTHGYKGEMKIFVEPAYFEDFMKNKRIFVDVKGTKVPYFVSSVRGANDLIIQLEDVPTKEIAFLIQSREIFLREKDLIPAHKRTIQIEEEGLEYEHLAGFTLEDQHTGVVGVIDEILDMPQQEMAFLKHKGREILIPLNEALIVKIDEANKHVLMDLPDGLLDM